MARIDPQLYDQAGSVFNVDPGLLRAISRVESGENPDAVGPPTRYGNARGAMQFIEPTARQYGVTNPHDPRQAVFGAAAYISDLLDRHQGNVPRALQEYNGATGDPAQKYTRLVAAQYQPTLRPQAQAKAATQPPAAPAADGFSDLDSYVSKPPAKAAVPSAPAAQTPGPASQQAEFSDLDSYVSTPPATAAAPPASPEAGPAPPAQNSPASTTPDVPPPSSEQPGLMPPTVRSVGAGALQGVRDFGQTLAGWAKKGDEASPTLAAIDRWAGLDPAAAEKTLAGQTNAFEQQHGQETSATIGRIGGNILATTPFLPVGLLGRGVEAGVNALAPRIANLVRGVTEGAIAGGGTSAGTSGPSGENPLDAAKEGALMGGVLGGAMPMVRTGLSAFGKRELKGVADRLGIDVTTGQHVGGIVERVEDASKIVPGSGAAAAASRQNGQIAQAIAKEAGIPGPVQQLNTPMLNQAERRAGTAMENAARSIDVPGDNTFLTELGRIETAAKIAGADAPEAKAAGTLIDRILTTMSNRGGSMPGQDFQRFIARGGELDAALNNSNRDIASAAWAIREALLDSAERSGSTGVKALQDGRYQYKVIKTVRDAIDKTPDGSEGMSQARLAQLIRGNFDMTRTGPGNNMQDLARLLQGIRPLASSGTAERAAMYGALGVGGGGGALYYAQHPDQVEDFLLKGALPAAALAVGGRASRFGPGLGFRAPATGAKWLSLNPLLPRAAGPATRQPESDNALAR